MTKIAGTLSTTARFMASKQVPWFTEPSPLKEMATLSRPRIFAASAAPTDIGGPPATMPLAPRMPWSMSAICMLPPLPLHSPSEEPQSSFIMPITSAPLAMQ